MAEPDPEPMTSGAGQRLGAPETLGISTLDPGLRPPTMPPGRHVTIRVRMLDDTEELFDISQKASGKVLFDLVCSHMNLIEGDYFGLEFQNHQKMMVWLDHIKPIIKQLRRPKHTTLRFAVKFFPPDHAQLLEDLTRYLFALQIKQDLSSGRLPCNDSSAALMVSHIIQSEIGDFEESQCRSHLLNNNYIPEQMPLIDKIMEFHSKNIGQTPAESDYQLLEVARRLEMYGIRLHPAKDREGTRLSLAVAHTGVLVFQGQTKINAFNWSKVRKLSFKRKRFLIKLRPDLNSSYQDTLEFLMASRDCCKVFWKICVEYHAFFRLFEEPKPKPKPVLFTRGSSFRFSGRTQKQVIDYVKESEFKKIPFERKHSRVQHNSRLSPLPSPRHHEVPVEVSVSHTQKKQTFGQTEDPSASRTATVSPSHQRNGHGDRTGSVSRTEERRGSQTNPEHLSTGPASRAAKGSSFSIPYIDFSDLDSDYGMGRDQVCGLNDINRERASNRCGSDSGSTNRALQAQPEHFLGRIQYRESPSSSKPSLTMSPDVDESSKQSQQRVDKSPLRSSMVDVSARSREKHSSSPLTVPYMMGSKSGVTTSVVDLHQAASITHAGHNGYSSSPPHFNEGGYSPISSRCPRLQKPIRTSLTQTQDQGASSPESCPVQSRAERMAALERRMLANGLSAPGRSRARRGQKRLGHAAVTHVGAIHLHDCSTTSGSESSESEVETYRGNSPQMFDNPVEANSTSPIPRNKFSFGSLQLEEEGDEDGCHGFSDDDGGQLFSC
uniref:FERM, ARH/RhoGEF and pleckstrin domain protein 1 n=1 Tax=Mastacembelus armatus TaxID=205130 RepID=A0A7N8Y972_9TELE